MSAAVNVFIADLPPSFKKGGWGWIFKIPLYPPFPKGEGMCLNVRDVPMAARSGLHPAPIFQRGRALRAGGFVTGFHFVRS